MSIFRLTDVSDATREAKAYWDKRVDEHWEKPTHGLYLDRTRLAAMDKRNLSILRSMLGDYATPGVLECACGYGRYVPFLIDWCSEYTGIDLATRNIEEARTWGVASEENVSFEVGDMLTYKTEKRFELIFMVAAWSSIERNSAEIIKHLKTLLAPGGKIAVFEEHLYMVIDQ